MPPRHCAVALLASVAVLGCSSVEPNDPPALLIEASPPSGQLESATTAARCVFPWLPWAGLRRCSPGANDPSRIVQIRAGAPPLETTEVSFYAVRGKTRDGRIFFTNGTGGRGSEYLRITVGPGSLRTSPNGAPVAPGDSVLITMRVLSTQQMLWELLPHGLSFNPQSPAHLVAHYTEADKDFDHDGDRDLIDVLIETQLAIWRQPWGQLFAKLLSILDIGRDQIDADLPGFSRFAIAY